MRKFSYGLVALMMVAALASIALAGTTGNGSTSSMEGGGNMKNQPSVYKVKQLGVGKGQNGTVSLQAMGEKTKVVIEITNEPAGAIEPSHVHVGNCAHPGKVIYPLTDVVAGHSTTIVDAPISKIAITGNSVNIHKSAAQLNLYLSCADLGPPNS
jgi:hypothetical protein